MKHLLPLSLLLTVTLCAPVSAQFRAEFDDGALATDPRGLDGWAFFTGDGAATMAFEPGDGYASGLMPRPIPSTSGGRSLSTGSRPQSTWSG